MSVNKQLNKQNPSHVVHGKGRNRSFLAFFLGRRVVFCQIAQIQGGAMQMEREKLGERLRSLENERLRVSLPHVYRHLVWDK